MKPTGILTIDGDIPVYNVAFACVDETEAWKVDWSAKKQFETICSLATGYSHYTGFLTDSKYNFRLKRATTLPYKGQRKDKDKEPVAWYDEIRDYYMEANNFQMMKGVEADDALVIAAEVYRKKGIPVACATKDKDLKQYDWDLFIDLNDLTTYPITPEEANRNLWKQMLLGDVAVDNIPGLSHAAKYGTTVETMKKIRGSSEFLVGKAKVEKLLDLWEPSDYPERIYEMYLDWYQGDIGNTQEVIDICEENNWTFGEYRFYETFDLIYMLRKPPKDLKITYDYFEIPDVTSGHPSRAIPEF